MDNILHPYRITSALKLDDEVRDRAAALARDMGIGDKLGRLVTDLSQGEKQRAAICRALLPGPNVILADEATGNLDPDVEKEILRLLFRINSSGTAVLMATHNHALVKNYGL